MYKATRHPRGNREIEAHNETTYLATLSIRTMALSQQRRGKN